MTLRSIVMLGRTYEGQNCSVAKSLELIGERWTMLILREVFLGNRRFDEMATPAWASPATCSRTRLTRLVEEGVLEKVRYQERPERFEYRLTEKGIDLWPVMVSLIQYGDRYYAPDGPPMILVHKDCGGTVDAHRICSTCGERLTARAVTGRAWSRRSARRRLSSRITRRAVVSGTSETIEISRSRRRPPSSVIAQRQTASSRSSQRVR